MNEKVGIRFRSCGKMYYFGVYNSTISNGDCVVVESSFGMTIGRVVTDRLPVAANEKGLKKVIRKATDEDIKKKQKNAELERDARVFCLERIYARGLPMKLVCTESTLDRKRIIFYFTADGRIDFRELVKDLASKFKTRIEMRQIGVRDETKLLGGIGVCGKEVCCRTFLTSFAPISIKMAKKQELVLNTNKLSGLCGRLMCCLNYEYNQEELKKIALSENEIEIPDEKVLSLSEMDESLGIEHETAGGFEAGETHKGGDTVASRVAVETHEKASEEKQEATESSDADRAKKKGRRRSRKFLRRKKKKKTNK